MPVRVGVPGEYLSGLADSVSRPQFATATGLALFGAKHVAESGFAGGFSLGQGVVAKTLSWLKEFF
jgi:cell division protein FtsA